MAFGTITVSTMWGKDGGLSLEASDNEEGAGPGRGWEVMHLQAL